VSRLLNISDAANIGIHAMLYIANHDRTRPWSAAEIAGDLNVSEAHLGKVLQRLTRLGFLTSRRGPRGGFNLGRDPSTVSILDVLSAIDGPLDNSGCLLGRALCPADRCAMGDVLGRAYGLVHAHLSSTRLSDVTPASPA
jgi:Rrf2 family protein